MTSGDLGRAFPALILSITFRSSWLDAPLGWGSCSRLYPPFSPIIPQPVAQVPRSPDFPRTHDGASPAFEPRGRAGELAAGPLRWPGTGSLVTDARPRTRSRWQTAFVRWRELQAALRPSASDSRRQWSLATAASGWTALCYVDDVTFGPPAIRQRRTTGEMGWLEHAQLERGWKHSSKRERRVSGGCCRVVFVRLTSTISRQCASCRRRAPATLVGLAAENMRVSCRPLPAHGIIEYAEITKQDC